jgi:hypothetical protein
MLKRYHRDIGIPASVEDPVIGAALTYTVHAHQEAQKDHAQHCLPQSVPRDFELIEVDVIDGIADKWVIRFPISVDTDMVLAISSGYLVKTVWLNRAGDTHTSLDHSKYDRPEPEMQEV